MNLYLKISILLLALSSCSLDVNQERVFKENFNSEELSYLNEIEELFYGQICQGRNQDNLNDCFRDYSKAAYEVFSVDDDAIFPAISYDSIWTFLANSSPQNLSLIWKKNTVGYALSLNLESTFFELLKAKGPEESYLVNRIIQQQDIGPGDIVHLLSYPEKYDLNNRIIRLTVAIDIITQIDREKEKSVTKKAALPRATLVSPTRQTNEASL